MDLLPNMVTDFRDRAIDRWEQSPTYAVSHDPQEVERSLFPGQSGGAKIGPL
jgi:hypothetical protein